MSDSDREARDRDRRKRLRYRSWRRGTREMDLLLGGFADRHLASLSPGQLDRLEALLEIGDPELYGWLRGFGPVPEAYDNDVLALMRNFKFSPE